MEAVHAMIEQKFEEVSFQRLDANWPSSHSTGKFRRATYNGVDVAVKEYPLGDRSLFRSADTALQQWQDEIGTLIKVKTNIVHLFDYFAIGILALVDHPNIVKLIGGNGPAANSDLLKARDPYIVTQFIPKTLDTIETLAWTDNLLLLGMKKSIYQILTLHKADIASALKLLHSIRWAHRDLKPSNIGVATDSTTGRLRAVIIDFGSTRYVNKNINSYCANIFIRTSELTRTIPYSAPEVLTSKAYSLECDIYSFGQIFLMLAIKASVAWSPHKYGFVT